MALRLRPSGSVLRGLLAPHALRLAITNDDDDEDPLDLTTVLDAAIQVHDELAGTDATWSPSIVEGATESALELVFMFDAETSEIPAPTTKRLTVELTTPGGVRIAGPATLYVT